MSFSICAGRNSGSYFTLESSLSQERKQTVALLDSSESLARLSFATITAVENISSDETENACTVGTFLASFVRSGNLFRSSPTIPMDQSKSHSVW